MGAGEECWVGGSLSTWAVMPWEDLQNFPSLREGCVGKGHEMRDVDPSYGDHSASGMVAWARQ